MILLRQIRHSRVSFRLSFSGQSLVMPWTLHALGTEVVLPFGFSVGLQRYTGSFALQLRSFLSLSLLQFILSFL